MNKQAKAVDIPQSVKCEVWERDDHRCVLCGSPYAMPNAHYIARSHGGLGIPENIVTLCLVCHDRYDNSTERTYLRQELRAYLKGIYPDWDEETLVYHKWRRKT